jgi:hypothetical protein
MPDGSDEGYYASLEQGAEFLANEATDPGQRAVHLKMANIYRNRALDAARRKISRTAH